MFTFDQNRRSYLSPSVSVLVVAISEGAHIVLLLLVLAVPILQQ